MSSYSNTLKLPPYDPVEEIIAVLNLPFSLSELHGLICGYVSVGADEEAQSYLQAIGANEKSEESRQAMVALFDIFSISQQQLIQFDFEFQMMLPDEEAPLSERARAFSAWCEGFTRALAIHHIDQNSLSDEEAQESLLHLAEFSELDHDMLEANEEDEVAFMEVHEYARMAVLKLFAEIHSALKKNNKNKIKH